MTTKAALISGLLIAALPFNLARAQNAPTADADPALAERFADLAASTLDLPVLNTSQYRQAAALLQAASRVAPNEPRFPRLRFEAMLQAGEIADATDSLVQYCRLDPTDLQAQAKLIELYVQRMETADDKLKYLRTDLLGTNTIPAEIRSHAALLAARVSLERGDRQAAIAALNEAIRLNPVNGEAQQLKFELVSSKGTANDRLNGLLAVVRASPTKVGAVSAVAEELSRAGLGEQAAIWYDAALGSFLRSGQMPPHAFVIDYASQMLANGSVRDADGLVSRILAGDPSDTAAHILRVAIDRAINGPGALSENAQKNRQLARTALVNRFIEVSQSAGEASATTRPTTSVEAFAYPDPVVVAGLVKAKNDPALVEAFTAAAGDLALFQLIFAEEAPPARALLGALSTLLPADALMLARIDGWAFVVEGKPAEARARLSGVADRDPIAALGLVRLDSDSTDPALRQAAESRARQVRSNHSHGLTGALVASELLPRRTPLVLSATAEQMKQQLDGFPMQILRLNDSPESFYVLRAEPVSPVIAFGQPLMVKVSLLNTSDLDLAIGEGSIRNDLWFDANVRGMQPASFPSTAYDRLGGPLVLRPRQVATRTVRVDDGSLGTYLRNTPLVSLPVFGSVLTNPVSTGSVVPGPGGYAVQFSRIVEQSPVPFLRAESRQKFLEGLKTAPPNVRLGLIDAGVVYFEALSKPAEGKENNLPAEDLAALRIALDGLVNDPDNSTRAYGTFHAIKLAGAEKSLAIAKTAATDPFWGTRLLSMVALRQSFQRMPAGSDVKPLADFVTGLAADPDATVSAFAKAVMQELQDMN